MTWNKQLQHWLDDSQETLQNWWEDGEDWLDDVRGEANRGRFPWWLLAAAGAAAALYWLSQNRREEIKALAIDRFIEQSAEGQSFLSLEDDLKQGGEAVVRRATRAADTEENREQLRHIIGMERWGRARLQSAVLHRPWVLDEHYDYKPPRDLSMAELTEMFAEQRRRTAALARSLHENPPRSSEKVLHNSHGPLSVRGWLRYLNLHADIESRKLRSR